jgi:hypothetical protein
MPKGGRRKGAGRRVGSGLYGEPTQPMRSPISIKDLHQMLNQYYRLTASRFTSLTMLLRYEEQQRKAHGDADR